MDKIIEALTSLYTLHGMLPFFNNIFYGYCFNVICKEFLPKLKELLQMIIFKKVNYEHLLKKF